MSAMEQMGAPARRVVAAAAERSGIVQRIPISSREQWLAARRQDVTASVAGALFGVHDYQTPYGLYCDKAGIIEAAPEDEPSIAADSITLPPTLRGTLLEPAALALLGQLRPAWSISAANDTYWRMPAHRIGATPDAFATDPTRPGCGIIQIKTTSDLIFTKKWRDEDGIVQAPTWIAVQAIVEAKLTGSSWACVALFVSGINTALHVIDIPLHDGLWTALQGHVREFWSRVEGNRPYDPDYGRDAALIHRINARDDGSEIDLTGDNRMAEIVAERESLKAIEKAGSEAEKVRRVIDAEIIGKMGVAARARIPGGVITAKTIRREAYQAKASTYRKIAVHLHEGSAA